MKNLEQIRLDRLNSRLTSLLNDPSATAETIDEAVAAIKQAEKDKKKANFKARLEYVNKEHEKRRNLLRKWLEIDFPNEDITNQDMTFHSTKMRKVEGLVELVTGGYVTAKFENGHYTEIKTGGGSFRILASEYKYNEPTKYFPFETFEKACKHNGIKPEKVSFAKAWSNAQKIEREGEKIRELIKKHGEKVESLDKHFLESENLIDRLSEGKLYTNRI